MIINPQILYYLFDRLSRQGIDFPGAGLMHYITFRSLMAAIVAIFCSLLIGKRIIKDMHKKQIGEEIRDLGLEGQLRKEGTPTMGGIIILLSILIPALLFCDLKSVYIQMLLVTTVALGALGFADDYIKTFKHDKNGLKPWYKIAGQVALGLYVALNMCFNPQCKIVVTQPQDAKVDAIAVAEDAAAGNKEAQRTFEIGTTKTTIPFVKHNEFDYRWLSPFRGRFGEMFMWFLYVLVIIFIITACSNGSNLTDGMDGLDAGVSAICGTTLGILAYLSGNTQFAGYLNIMYIPSSGEITVFMASMLGALLGFLWFNSYPAQIFMGDTGSLALGGIIGVCAVIIRKELLLPILCGIFLVESLSVIIQRWYFKATKKKYGEGRRIFRMTPLHHHYQRVDIPAKIKTPKEPVPEAKIVSRFWIVGLILAVLTIVTLKIR